MGGSLCQSGQDTVIVLYAVKIKSMVISAFLCVEEDKVYLCFAKNKSGKLSDLGTDNFGELQNFHYRYKENTTSQNFNQVLLTNTLNLTQSESVVKLLKKKTHQS